MPADWTEAMRRLYEASARGLLAQGRRSTLPGNPHVSAYRGPGGLRSAVGFLIDDGRYRGDLEARSAGSDPVVRAVEASMGVRVADWRFLKHLQGVHDHHLPHQWRGALRAFGRSWGLDTAFLERSPDDPRGPVPVGPEAPAGAAATLGG